MVRLRHGSFECSSTQCHAFPGAKRFNHGNYTVTLDDAQSVTASGSVPDPGLFQEVLFSAQNLDLGTHTIEFVNVPMDAVHAYVDIDFIVYETEILSGMGALPAYDASQDIWQYTPGFGEYFGWYTSPSNGR